MQAAAMQFPTSIRELSQEEVDMIAGGDGGPTAGGLANAMVGGAVVGFLVAGPAGVLEGAILGGIGYAAGGLAESLF